MAIISKNPGKTLQIKFPTLWAQKIVKCPGFAPAGGWGMLKFRFDRRITFGLLWIILLNSKDTDYTLRLEDLSFL